MKYLYLLFCFFCPNVICQAYLNISTSDIGLRSIDLQKLRNITFNLSTNQIQFNATSGQTVAHYISKIQKITFSSTQGGDILPVELSSFSLKVIKSSVKLQWETSSEINTAEFVVERANSGERNFKTVGTIPALGMSNSLHLYIYTDTNLWSGNYSYRLKMIDRNGTFTYSPVISAKILPNETFTVEQNYPNPFNPSTTILYQVPYKGSVIIRIYSLTGQILVEKNMNVLEPGNYTFIWDSKNKHNSLVGSGTYLFTVNFNNTTISKKMILIR